LVCQVLLSVHSRGAAVGFGPPFRPPLTISVVSWFPCITFFGFDPASSFCFFVGWLLFELWMLHDRTRCTHPRFCRSFERLRVPLLSLSGHSFSCEPLLIKPRENFSTKLFPLFASQYYVPRPRLSAAYERLLYRVSRFYQLPFARRRCASPLVRV